MVALQSGTGAESVRALSLGLAEAARRELSASSARIASSVQLTPKPFSISDPTVALVQVTVGKCQIGGLIRTLCAGSREPVSIEVRSDESSLRATFSSSASHAFLDRFWPVPSGSMRSSKIIHVVSCHAEGEVGDVIVGGVASPPGATLWDQRHWIAEDRGLRDFVLNEPRGGVFRHVNLLVPAVNPAARMGWIIMEPEDTPPMSGSNAICVSTVLLDTGIVEMTEPLTHLVLEAPGGLVRVEADCANGKAERIHVTNLPSFADRLDVPLDVPGLGSITVDTAYGGDSFVVVDAAKLGLDLCASNARPLAEIGMRITAAADAAIGFSHPDVPEWNHISFCLFAGPLEEGADGFEAMSAVAIRPGKIDRSPTGTAVSARMALLHARGEMRTGDRLVARSIIGSTFEGTILSTASVADRAAIVPRISGRAWITGVHQHMLDPDDPWPRGYKLGDTWPIG